MKKFETIITVMITFLVVLAVYVAATGWSGSEPSHTILFTDTLRGKSGNQITFDDIYKNSDEGDDYGYYTD